DRYTTRSPPAGVSERLCQAIVEQHSIGKFGQGIKVREMADGGFVPSSRGDVAAIHHDSVDVGIVEEIVDRRLQRAPSAIPLTKPELDRLTGFATRLSQMVQQRLGVLRMHVLRQPGADQIRLLIAEKSIDGWTGIANRGLVIDDRNDVRRILDERSKAPLILLERSLRAAPRRSLSGLA